MPLDNCRPTFVNAGAVGPVGGGAQTGAASEAKRRSLERFFREEVTNRCRELRLDDDATARRQESIRSITMDEFLAEPGSADVFDADEVEGWR